MGRALFNCWIQVLGGLRYEIEIFWLLWCIRINGMHVGTVRVIIQGRRKMQSTEATGKKES